MEAAIITLLATMIVIMFGGFWRVRSDIADTKADISRVEGSLRAEIARVEGKLDTDRVRIEAKLDAYLHTTDKFQTDIKADVRSNTTDIAENTRSIAVLAERTQTASATDATREQLAEAAT